LDKRILQIKNEGGKALKGIKIEVEALTVSFREAAGQLYHETLPLPPPSTILGVAGAALGKSFEETLNFFKKNHIGVGCRGSHQGRGKDLWNYTKLKCSGKVEKDIVIREFLYGFKGELYYICKDEEIAKLLYNAFLSPSYGLTLGNNDDLIKIKKVTWYDRVDKDVSTSLSNTWVCGDILSEIELNWDEIKDTPIVQTITPPLVKTLPTDYVFDNKGARQGRVYQDFTFLGDKQKLTYSMPTYLFENTAVSCFIFSEQKDG